MIPAEAVDAAAAAWLAHKSTRSPDNAKEAIREALDAAAPYMFAQALEEAVHAFPLETIHAPDNAVVWMMRRAEELRSKQ